MLIKHIGMQIVDLNEILIKSGYLARINASLNTYLYRRPDLTEVLFFFDIIDCFLLCILRHDVKLKLRK